MEVEKHNEDSKEPPSPYPLPPALQEEGDFHEFTISLYDQIPSFDYAQGRFHLWQAPGSE